MKITHLSFGEVKQKADLLIAGSFFGDKTPPAALGGADAHAAHIAREAIKMGRFNGKKGEVYSTYCDDLKTADELVLMGLGKKDDWNPERLRETVAAMLRAAKDRNAKSVRVVAESFVGKSVQAEDTAEIIPEILQLSDYRFGKYQTKGKDATSENGKQAVVRSVEALYSSSSTARKSALDQAFERAQIIADAVVFTRNVINEPANVMPPREVAAHARQLAREGGFRCEVLGLSQIKQKKMGGIIAVSQGSKEPPQLIVLEYGGAYKRQGTICLVGKGVTFDTGGISIKPSKDMEKMKYDMSGAASVLGILKAVGRLKPKLHIVGIAPCVENMPSGSAQRPGDIIRMFNGKSVEVINTDAEGRLILGDALAYTERFKPKTVIDFATLTGACVVALGDKAIGLMGTDPALIGKIKKAGEATGERCWELPLWDEYFQQIKGHHSDILNAGTGGGGTITAGMFLKQFVPVTSWAHLDIAGTAWVDSDKPFRARGATGVGVRLTLELLRNWK